MEYYKKLINPKDLKDMMDKDWGYIVNNTGKDEKERGIGTGRVTTAPDCIQKSEQIPNIAKYRAVLDILIGFVARGLGLGAQTLL